MAASEKPQNTCSGRSLGDEGLDDKAMVVGSEKHHFLKSLHVSTSESRTEFYNAMGITNDMAANRLLHTVLINSVFLISSENWHSSKIQPRSFSSRCSWSVWTMYTTPMHIDAVSSTQRSSFHTATAKMRPYIRPKLELTSSGILYRM